jgi:hypothetical protein
MYETILKLFRTPLKVLPDLGFEFVVGPELGNYTCQVRLPEDVTCDQCILQVSLNLEGKIFYLKCAHF